MPQEVEYPVVMRMHGLYPRDLAGFEKHRRREGGDLGHINDTPPQPNTRLIGPENWAELARKQIRNMALANHARKLESLERRRRRAEAELVLAEGPQDPWRPTRHGPMREIILTANKAWFEDDLDDLFIDDLTTRPKATRQQQFEERGVAWLIARFGDDCVHARADHDEETYHIHAVILPRAVSKDGRQVLQPSVHPMIRNYEAAKDDVGEWFQSIGLTRGRKRRRELMAAYAHNKKLRENGASKDKLVPLPEYRQHVTPRKYREQKERDMATASRGIDERTGELSLRAHALDQRERALEAREVDADAVIEMAEEVAAGQLDGVLSATSENVEPAPDDTQPLSRRDRARRAFGKAIIHLATKTRAEFAEAFGEIRAADTVLVQILSELPTAARTRLRDMRRGLTKIIIGLERDPELRALTRPEIEQKKPVPDQK